MERPTEEDIELMTSAVASEYLQYMSKNDIQDTRNVILDSISRVAISAAASKGVSNYSQLSQFSNINLREIVHRFFSRGILKFPKGEEIFANMMIDDYNYQLPLRTVAKSYNLKGTPKLKNFMVIGTNIHNAKRMFMYEARSAEEAEKFSKLEKINKIIGMHTLSCMGGGNGRKLYRCNDCGRKIRESDPHYEAFLKEECQEEAGNAN